MVFVENYWSGVPIFVDDLRKHGRFTRFRWRKATPFNVVHQDVNQIAEEMIVVVTFAHGHHFAFLSKSHKN